MVIENCYDLVNCNRFYSSFRNMIKTHPITFISCKIKAFLDGDDRDWWNISIRSVRSDHQWNTRSLTSLCCWLVDNYAWTEQAQLGWWAGYWLYSDDEQIRRRRRMMINILGVKYFIIYNSRTGEISDLGPSYSSHVVGCHLQITKSVQYFVSKSLHSEKRFDYSVAVM